jgi:LytS/YehU family sensor histidine kinase
VVSLLIAFAFSVFSHWFRRSVFHDMDIIGIIDIATLADALLSAGAVLIATLIFVLCRRQKMVLANEQLQSERLIARCEALEKQVNPHFLFNSLNTLGGLIGVDDDSAQHYLQQLASTYRYIMQQHVNHTVPFADELAFVDTYCDMMQIRYGGNLRIIRRIDPALLQHRVPPISVQLLVENAIKHNVVSDRHPLTITIETIGGSTLRVSNTLQLKQDEQDGAGSLHVGLDNLNQRYKLLFHQEINIQQTETDFVVELPLIA